MLEVLSVVRGEFAAEFAAQTDPVLGASTLSIGNDSTAGTKTNIIPDKLRPSVDMRFRAGDLSLGESSTNLASDFGACVPDVEVRADQGAAVAYRSRALAHRKAW
jgi:acetylornithine deacetylase/succinyl-diaminopimelate desuccinylase-like protein